MSGTKTTLNLDPALMAKVKAEASKQGCTMTELIERAIRLLFQRRPRPTKLPALPRFDGVGAKVDIADRDALYRAMEGR